MCEKYKLRIFLTLITIFGRSLQDCSLEGESSEADKVISCNDTIITDDLERNYKIPYKEIEEITFINTTGHMKSSVFKNANSLKRLLILRSTIRDFEPEVNTLKTIQIHHSHFAEHSNFDKCCRRLKKLLLRNTTGFFLEESVFNKLSRLKELKLSHQNVENLSESVFKGLKSLEKLRISDMNFKNIDSNAFADLTELEELYIEEPNIDDLDVNVFKPLRNLKVLNIINANRLKPLPLEMFSNLRSLRHLGLPLSTWKIIDVQKIPVMFPKLYSYSRSGSYATLEEEKFFAAKFKKVQEIIFNRSLR